MGKPRLWKDDPRFQAIMDMYPMPGHKPYRDDRGRLIKDVDAAVVEPKALPAPKRWE